MAAGPVDFVDAERKAQAEVKKIGQLDCHRERGVVEEIAKQEAAALEIKSSAQESIAKTRASSSSSALVVPKPNRSGQDMNHRVWA